MEAGEVRRVGVVGCGLMGSGIVEVCARADLEVHYVEADEARVEHGRTLIERSLGKAVDRGKLGQDERAATLDRISGSTDLAALAAVDLVVEATTERLDLKREVFGRLDELTRPDVVLASNTSSLPITELGAATRRAPRVVGLHFFNPPPVMPLLEIVRGVDTAEDTMAFARAFGERIGKTTIVAKDRAGFIVNMLLVPYLNGAIRMLEEGHASAEDIDTGVRLGLGHPMGPITLLDLVGLDTAMHVANVLYEEFKLPEYAPPPLLRRMVAAGRLGRKSGRGFYDYSEHRG